LLGCGALLLGTVAAHSGRAQTDGPADEDNQPIDMNVIRMKAEAGHSPSQTMLADYLAASSDFTNAVIWYRKAAEQGSVSSQLSLASLLIVGRGTPKNPKEAAKWLRAAADGIETPRTVPSRPATLTATNTTQTAPAAIVITNNRIPTTTTGVTVATQRFVAPARVERISELQPPGPALPEVRPALKPPPEPK
jgi:Sel1 repeat